MRRHLSVSGWCSHTLSRWLVRSAVIAGSCGWIAWTAAPGRAGESPGETPRDAVRDTSRGTVAETAVVELGRRLFHDPAVSRNGRVACVSCHDPEHGWSAAERFSADADGATSRHSQSIADLANSGRGGSGFHWDGEFAAPRDLIVARIGDRAEADRAEALRRAAREKAGGDTGASSYGFGGLAPTTPSAADSFPIPERLSSDTRYEAAFRAAFGDGAITSERIVGAVDAFVGSLRTEQNALDRYLGGRTADLGIEERRGLALFRGKAGCATCHTLARDKDGRAILTDGKVHNTGVAAAQTTRNRQALAVRLEAEEIANAAAFLGALRGDDGRRAHSGRAAHTGAFKTPSLRDVSRRGPYMHDGSLATLEDVVRYYAKGGTPNPQLDAAVKPIDLKDRDVADLVAFLRALSGDARAGVLPPRARERHVGFSVVDLAGAPVAGLTIDVVPAGERLGGGPLDAAPVRVTTSQMGNAGFRFPDATHVALRSATHEIGEGRLVPDTSGGLELVAAPLDRIAVVLRGDVLPERIVGTTLPRPAARRTIEFPTTKGSTRFDLGPDPAAAESPPPEKFEFVRVRTVGSDCALYVARVGAARGPTFLRFDLPRPEVTPFRIASPEESLAKMLTRVAAVDLSGGWSEPSELVPLARAFDRRRGGGGGGSSGGRSGGL